MTLIFGLTRLFIGVAVGIFAFGFKKLKTGGFFTKYPYIAKAFSIICIFSGLYSIFLADPNSHSLSKNQWTQEDKKAIFENCIRDSEEMAIKFPKEIDEYCSCSTSGITQSISKNEYIEDSKKTVSEQMNNQFKYFEDCLAELKRATGNQK